MMTTPQPFRSPPCIALTFLRISLSSLGGGLSAHAYLILTEQKHWLSREEFLSFLALSRMFPGANMVNLAVCVGNRCGGAAGALAALVGLLLVPLLLILGLGLLYFRYQYLPGVDGALKGMAAVAVGLTLAMGLKTMEDYWREAWPVLLAALTFGLTALLRWSMFWVLLLLLPAAVGWSYRKFRCPEEKHD